MRKLVIGDIHGCHKGLLQCFERSEFDYNKDKLIVLGDVCDGWPFVKHCIDELLKVKNIVYILGNHDVWAIDWGKKGFRHMDWISQGGLATIESYNGQMEVEHIHFLLDAHLWYEEDNKLFVHAGIKPEKPMHKQYSDDLIWDRQLFESSHKKHFRNPNYKFSKFEEIFIGHTTTQVYRSIEPLHYCNVWNLDTGAGWSGKLTIMDVDTKEYWQSDIVTELYPEYQGRR